MRHGRRTEAYRKPKIPPGIESTVASAVLFSSANRPAQSMAAPDSIDSNEDLDFDVAANPSAALSA